MTGMSGAHQQFPDDRNSPEAALAVLAGEGTPPINGDPAHCPGGPASGRAQTQMRKQKHYLITGCDVRRSFLGFLVLSCRLSLVHRLVSQACQEVPVHWRRPLSDVICLDRVCRPRAARRWLI